MAGDQLVTARHIMRVLLEARGHHRGRGSRGGGGTTRLLEELEAAEPDLTEFVLESLLAIDKHLRDTSLSDRQALHIRREAEALVVVAVTALRRAHFELWRDTAMSTNPSPPPAPGDAPAPGDTPTPEGNPESPGPQE